MVILTKNYLIIKNDGDFIIVNSKFLRVEDKSPFISSSYVSLIDDKNKWHSEESFAESKVKLAKIEFSSKNITFKKGVTYKATSRLTNDIIIDIIDISRNGALDIVHKNVLNNKNDIEKHSSGNIRRTQEGWIWASLRANRLGANCCEYPFRADLEIKERYIMVPKDGSPFNELFYNHLTEAVKNTIRSSHLKDFGVEKVEPNKAPKDLYTRLKDKFFYFRVWCLNDDVNEYRWSEAIQFMLNLYRGTYSSLQFGYGCTLINNIKEKGLLNGAIDELYNCQWDSEQEGSTGKIQYYSYRSLYSVAETSSMKGSEYAREESNNMFGRKTTLNFIERNSVDKKGLPNVETDLDVTIWANRSLFYINRIISNKRLIHFKSSVRENNNFSNQKNLNSINHILNEPNDASMVIRKGFKFLQGLSDSKVRYITEKKYSSEDFKLFI